MLESSNIFEFQLVFIYDQATTAAILPIHTNMFNLVITFIPPNTIFSYLVIYEKIVYYHNLIHNYLHKSL